MADPVVELQSGRVRGIIEKHEEGFNYYAFKGIPYAETPSGKLRFKDPIPKKKWSGIIDCKNYRPMCLQYDLFLKITSISEDCLHLNVFTWSINKTNLNKPVMVAIHGGAFVYGSSTDFFYGPEYLIRKDVVLVTINYRLNVLGFLDLKHEIASGNQGLKDMVMAFQWVRQNIRQFGGDPNNVTAVGISAGASAAQLIAMSPMGKGLFQKIISQGGTIYCPWAFKIKSTKPNAIKLCSLLGRDLQDATEVFEFLQSVEPQMLIEGYNRLNASSDHLPFGPGIDDKSSNPFMPFDPHQKLLNDGIHLPSLLGCTSHDGLLILIGMTAEQYFQLCDSDFQRLLAHHSGNVREHYNLSLKQFRRLFFKNKAISEDTKVEFVSFTSDCYFREGIHRFAKIQAEKSSSLTYLYQFSYNSPYSLTKLKVKDGPSGCSHFDDIPYLFKMRAFESAGLQYWKKGTKDYEVMEQMTEMWTNFAKYGRPTIDSSQSVVPVRWLPIADGTMLRHLNIDEDIIMEYTINVEQKFLSAKSIKDE